MSSLGPFTASTQVASSVPFDNATNGFTATDVQAAIEEAQNTVDHNIVTSASTVTTSSGTYTLVSGMTITPPAGTYYAIFSGTFRIATNGADGNTAIFVGGSIIQDSNRRQFTTVTIVLGLIGNNLQSMGVPTAIVTVNGSQAIEGRFNATTGTIAVDDRNLILLRIG